MIDSLRCKESINKPASGMRIRCKNDDTLLACIKWYASAEFVPNDREYIDNNEWDEAKSESDPRVFQSFVWVDLKKSEDEGRRFRQVEIEQLSSLTCNN